MDPMTGRSKGFAFIVFNREQSVYSTLSMQEHKMMNAVLNVKKSRKKTHKIFIGGLTSEISNSDIEEHFNQFGQVLGLERPVDKDDVPCSIAFISMDKPEIVQALLLKESTKIKGALVSIKRAKPESAAPRSGQASGSYLPAASGSATAVSSSTKLFVYNVSEVTGADELKKAFGKHGTITEASNPGKGLDRKSTRLNSSHSQQSRMPSSA